MAHLTVQRLQGARHRHGMAMKFKGWPASAHVFFVGLEADNTKAYRSCYCRRLRA